MRSTYVDRLRGLSIALVVLMHSSALLPWAITPIPGWFVSLATRNGYLGVSMFFVISGFLITNKVLRPGPNIVRFSTWSFYSQRIGRILPCLVLMCVLGETFALLRIPGFTFDQNKFPAWELFTYIFTFRYNIYYVNHAGLVPRLWDVLWSLSIEEVFYLSFPILFGLIKRKALIIPALLVLVIVGPIRRLALGHLGLYDYFGCFDQIALGSLASFASSSPLIGNLRPHTSRILRWTSVIFIILVFFNCWIERDFVFMPSLVALGAAFYLVGCAYGRRQAPLNSSKLMALELCGRLSYEMYLFHLFLLLAITKFVLSLLPVANATVVSYVSNAIFWFLLVSFAWTISKSFSEPSNRAIRKFLEKIQSSLDIRRRFDPKQGNLLA
jgi:peptidoglycan/LPS O-acetylase OafA/YrhL